MTCNLSIHVQYGRRLRINSVAGYIGDEALQRFLKGLNMPIGCYEILWEIRQFGTKATADQRHRAGPGARGRPRDDLGGVDDGTLEAAEELRKRRSRRAAETVPASRCSGSTMVWLTRWDRR